MTSRICPTALPTGTAVLPRNSLRTPTKWPETHLIDETFGGEECAAENCERQKQITPQESVQYFLAS